MNIQNMHAVCRNWYAACVEGRGVGGQHRIGLLEEEELEIMTPLLLSTTFIKRRQQSNGSDL